MCDEFSMRFEKKTTKMWDVGQRQIRLVYRFHVLYILTIVYSCLAHIINLATQALIATKSQTKYFSPHDPESHEPDTTGPERDELGLVRAITVKVCYLLFAITLNS